MAKEITTRSGLNECCPTLFDSADRFDTDPIIHGFTKSLFTLQVALCCLHGNVPQQN